MSFVYMQSTLCLTERGACVILFASPIIRYSRHRQMNIDIVHADEKEIKRLEQASAFTCEGMLLDAENIAGIADVFVSEQLVREGTDEIAGYTWTGKE